jgi:hypothetical protein
MSVRSKKQEPTRATTVWTIMSSREFAAGVDDVRKGARPRFDVDAEDWDQWFYERGRLWACLAPRTMPLKKRGRVTVAAFHLFLDKMDLIP